MKFLLVTLMMLMCGAWPAAGAPSSISYSGRLADQGGVAVKGPVTLKLRFFTAVTAGTQRGATIQMDGVALRDGQFTLDLALTGAQAQAVFSAADQAVFLEIEDATHARKYPRQRFLAAPYALKVPVDGQSLAWSDTGALSLKSLAVTATPSVTLIGNAGHTVTLAAPAGLSGDVNLTLPSNDGAVGFVLTTDGDGVLSWSNKGGGAGNMDTGTFDATTNLKIDLEAGGTGADLSSTGGAGQYVKQAGVGSALTVGLIADGDVPASIARDGDLPAVNATTVGAAGAVLNSDLGTNGIVKKTGALSYTAVNNDATLWDAAYTQRLRWDGGNAGLNATTALSTLGIGTMGLQAAGAVAITGGTVAGAAFTNPVFANDALSGDKIHSGVISNFSSTGIDDNADAAAITIDINERVGLGEPTPLHALDINGGAHYSDQLLMGNGTAAAPSLSFASDPDTGVTLDAIVAGGGKRLDLRDTYIGPTTTNGMSLGSATRTWSSAYLTRVSGGDGAASTPAYTFVGDLNTGFYRAGTDDLRLVTAGADRLTIGATGNVGIGTNNPQSKLHVNGTARVAQLCDETGSNCKDPLDGWDSELTCRSGFVYVEADGIFSIDDFCIMKYEAKQEATTKQATSVATGTPWGSVGWYEARNACERIGAHLVTEGEWMTVARNVEATAINDIDGAGSIQLANGNSDGAPGSALATAVGAEPSLAGCTLTLPLSDGANAACELRGGGSYAGNNTDKGFFGTSNHFGQAYVAGGSNKSQLRTHVLSNGSVVWDMGGNLYEWTDVRCETSNWYNVASWTQWNVASVIDYEKYVAGPSGALTSTNGVGKYYGCTTNGNAMHRGANYNNGADAGIFSATFNDSPDDAAGASWGFRCAHGLAE